jgi:hypothetical protein
MPSRPNLQTCSKSTSPSPFKMLTEMNVPRAPQDRLRKARRRSICGWPRRPHSGSIRRSFVYLPCQYPAAKQDALEWQPGDSGQYRRPCALRCWLSPTAGVPSLTSGGSYVSFADLTCLSPRLAIIMAGRRDFLASSGVSLPPARNVRGRSWRQALRKLSRRVSV